VEAARKGLNLEGRVDWALLKKGLDKAGSTGEKIELVQKFQALCPESVRLRALLLRLYEKAKRYSEADDLVSELRTDPAADMAVRRQIGEHYLRRKEKKEARRAFSEIVESAPFDPWARRYLGHLYLAHGWCLDAHREYETLAQLLPHDQTVPLMVSQAAECSGRLDEALRLQAKVSESSEKGANRSGPAAAARVLTSLLLAELRQDARGKKDEKRLRMIRARSRRLGVQTWARKMLISVRWPDRHRPIQVKMKKPGDDRLLGLPIVSRHLGLSASRQKHRLPGKYHIEARLEPDDPERAQTVKAELVVLLDEATEKERLLTRKLVFKPGVSALTFTLEGSKLYGKAEQTLSSLEARLVREGLVDVQTLDPSIMVDLKYAREDNFMGKPVYGSFKEAYLRPEAAEKLAQASQILQTRHPKLRILVGDALRPRSVQRKMFALVKNTPMRPYVASPERGSIHNYGAAVDVTLYDTEAGSRLDMGTRMDHFGPLAQPALEQKYLRKGELTPLQVTNRRILRKAMKAAGWHVLRIEWWHFTAFPRKMVERIYRIID
jgi:D-alanyl-D-alanine dipeptidase